MFSEIFTISNNLIKLCDELLSSTNKIKKIEEPIKQKLDKHSKNRRPTFVGTNIDIEV